MQTYLRLPKDPLNLATMMNRLDGSRIIIKVSEDSTLPFLFDIAPIYSPNTISTTYKNNDYSTTQETNHIIEGYEIVYNKKIYEQELQKPNETNRIAAAEIVINFLVSGAGTTIGTLIGLATFFALSIGGAALVDKFEDKIKEKINPELFILLLVIAFAFISFFASLPFASHIANKKKAKIIDKGISLKYFATSFNNDLTLESKLPSQDTSKIKKILQKTFIAYGNEDKETLEKIAKYTVSNYYPNGSKSQESAKKLLAKITK